jgi:hypothetical protein
MGFPSIPFILFRFCTVPSIMEPRILPIRRGLRRERTRTVIAPGSLLLAASLFLGPERAVSTPLPNASPYHQSITDAAAGGDVALAVWLEEWSTVRAMRIDRDGRQLDARPLVLANRTVFRSRPAVARGNGRWLVVWLEDTQILGCFVDDDGRVGSLLTILPAATERVATVATVHVAFDGTRFLVVCAGDPQSAAVYVSADGSVLGSAIPLGIREEGRATVDLVATDSGFAAVFARQMRTPEERYTIEALRFGRDGALAYEVLDPGGPSFAAALHAAADGDELAVIWMAPDSWNTWSIHAKEGQSSRVIATQPLAPRDLVAIDHQWFALLADREQLRLEPLRGGTSHTWDVTGDMGFAAAASFGDRALVAVTVPVDQSEDPFAAVVDGALQEVAPLRRFAEEPAVQRTPAVARNASGESLVVWAESSILAVRLDAAGRVVDPQPLLLGPALEYGSRPAVASDGTDFLVAWQTGTGWMTRRVSRDGSLSEPSRQSVDAGINQNGCLCWTGNKYLLGYQRLRYATHWYSVSEVRAARVGANGAFDASPPMLLPGDAYNSDLDCSSIAGTTLFVWRGDAIEGAFVTAAGTVSATIELSPRDFFPSLFRVDPMPAMATNGSAFAVAWYADSIVQRALVSPEGTVTRPNDAPLSAPLELGSEGLGLAPLGSGFVLAFGTGDLLAVRLDANGQVIDAPVALSATAAAERQPVLAEGLAVYLRDTQSSLMPRWRVFTRTISSGPRRHAASPR